MRQSSFLGGARTRVFGLSVPFVGGWFDLQLDTSGNLWSDPPRRVPDVTQRTHAASVASTKDSNHASLRDASPEVTSGTAASTHAVAVDSAAEANTVT